MRWVCFSFVAMWSVAWAAADTAAEYPRVVPPLAEAQRTQLATADDSRPPDEPAWYGLLQHVAGWDRLSVGPDSWVDDTGKAIYRPIFARLLKQPSAYRGDVFVVEGRFAGRQRRQVVLREGPWGRALTEWGVVLDSPSGGANSGGGQERIVIVYLVDPDGRQAVPRRNQRVQIVTRFYKLWQDVDAEGQPATYPVFVGRTAALIEPAGVATDTMFRQLIVGAIVVLMVGLFGIRWWARRQRVAGRRRPRLGERRRGDRLANEDDDDDVPLPDDPAEALAALDDTAGEAGRRDA